MDYINLKNQYIVSLNKGIHNRKEARTAYQALEDMQQEARKAFKNPDQETHDLAQRFIEAIGKGIQNREQEADSVFRQRAEVEKEAFVERISAEMDATVNALALSMTNQLMSAQRKSPAHVQKITEQALSSREGAMALLRVPAGLVNGRTLDKAVETAKSLECKAFESSRNARLESLDKRYAKAYMEGFQMRKIRENVEKSIRGNPFFDMGQETV